MKVSKFCAVAIVAIFAFAGVGFAEVEIQGDVYSLDTCPVSGEKLGAMGDPVKVNHEGRDVSLCCSGCIKKFEAEAQKYLSRIDAKMIADQIDHYPLTTCAVADGKLGEMGEPVSVVVNNRLVQLCCAGCEKKLRADPAQFIAKLDAAVIAQQSESYPFEVCMVSGERLGGSHGKTIEKVVANRLVKFCCDSCVTIFNASPAKYLHMLDTGVLEVSADEGSSSKHEESASSEHH